MFGVVDMPWQNSRESKIIEELLFFTHTYTLSVRIKVLRSLLIMKVVLI